MDLYKAGFTSLHVDYFDSISSTSQFLKQKAKSQLEPSLCVADIQTQGYGQRSSNWESDQESITFSLLLPVIYPIDQLYGFSQLLALSVKGSLELYSDQDYKVKWPNDIYMGESKVAGVLVEVVSQTDNLCWLVIGVGVNTGDFNQQFEEYSAKGVPLNKKFNKSSLTTQLAQDLIVAVNNFHPAAWISKKDVWSDSDFFSLYETVCLRHALFDIGYYLGVSDSGSLRIQDVKDDTSKGTIEITAGQVSVRKIKDKL
ncbi:biotin--[acetyl-CoA-carboxylase] ligase [Thiomicrospira pelophila]|uniref:biotin--[acetyl-CoA-carboxylase] ligase n=1 Tax=Thiomicrospira pelophila TaxID=934 RepID=UPI0004A6D569|nr:biotin--[acetyl-CoA-carboxylase] ligase [Thiomicrospira pelophila]